MTVRMRDETKSRPIRGRPPGQMTLRRRLVLEAIEAAVSRGDPVPSLSALARRCGLYDHHEARRVRNDLRKMGRLAL